MFRLLYDEVDGYGKGHVAESILVIAKYELSDSQVVDKEINAMAMIIELLGVIKKLRKNIPHSSWWNRSKHKRVRDSECYSILELILNFQETNGKI